MHGKKPHHMQKELGQFGTGTRQTMMHKLDPPGGYSPFLPISAYLARMKTPALLCLANVKSMLCVHGEKPHHMQKQLG